MASVRKQVFTSKLITAVLFLLLLLPSFYALFTAIDIEYSWLKKAAYLAVVIVLLLLPALFLKARTYFITEGLMNFFFFPIDIASLYLNRQPTSTAFLQNILHTDRYEALELLGSLWSVCIVVVMLWTLYFILAAHVENQLLFPRKARLVLFVSLGILLSGGWIAMFTLQKFVFPDKPTKTAVKDAVDAMWLKLYKIYPYNLYLETADIIRMHRQQVQLQEQINQFSFGFQPKKEQQPEIYVLVIGEATRYDHLGLNGYARNTTPLLAQCRNLISYDSAFAQANLTSYSVPLMVTRATARDPETAYREKSLPEAFQEAGFRTGVICKQVPSLLFKRIMQVSDDAFTYSKPIDVVGNYDEEMTDQLRAITRDTAQFAVLHSLGCHFRYEQRYPDAFAVYEPVLGLTFSYSMIAEENKDKLINAYDNAILYTDYFLNGLIQYLDSLNRPAVMLYMADHGESFWDDERKLSLHGSYLLSEYEYHVPLLIWYSDEYAALYPDKVKVMQQNKNTPVSSDVIFYSMLDLAGIEGDIVDSSRSIASPSLVPVDTVWVHTGSGSVEPFGIR